ncbi:MAG: hypothetical protein A3C90_01325 [Candidatus Magasanikbacteria bacterium RIFCSPHIGHO2_02_FULL_51_14]|uniref:DUF11 domain-containing protein n=1 Tax=Candidatus Magasanikbacteria bacterium RIFCSPHIGHO2_02_FULL_51_14 TaxID=1798683 RepID=A0A1F6MD84_9BACT|nr:MAG: hypothetical protein A3C90_01325 [Candidatus Magasanikbacteria bacterium RIFCSPHIGHO2_02_FULL_51_14]
MPLAKVVLQVRYPEGFVLTEASPEPTNDNRDEWVLGSIEEHGSGYIDIIGKLYGDLGKKQSFRAFLNYVPSNFSAEFQKVASVAAEVTQSPVSLTVLGPEEVAAGAEAEFTLLVAKQGDAPAEELAVVFDPGDLFTLKESEPDSDNDNKYRWSVPELADEMKIVLRGSFAEGAPDGANVAFSVLGWKDESRTFDGYVLQKVARSVKIAQTDVSASLAINGTLTDFSVQPGEALHASIAIANNGDDAIENVSVTVVFDTPSYDNKSMLDWTKLEDEADGAISGEQRSADTRRGGILWNKNKVSALARIEPGSDATIDFTIPLKSAEGIDLAGFTTHEIIAVVDLQYSKGGEQKTLSGNPITMTVNSDATLGVQDELSAADDGKEQHRITWIVNNTFHELKDISLEADFYGDIQLADDAMVVPAGTAAFDKDAGRLLWSVESMPTSVDVLAFQFDAVLNSKNPSQTNLASKVRFKATDVITGQEIILAGDEILLNAE